MTGPVACSVVGRDTVELGHAWQDKPNWPRPEIQPVTDNYDMMQGTIEDVSARGASFCKLSAASNVANTTEWLVCVNASHNFAAQ